MIMSRPRTQTIPTDIVNHIFSILHSDQAYTTLETCSSVFPLLADLHLYSQITFCELPENLQESAKETYLLTPTNFSLILIDRPHVVNCVRVVGIIIAGSGFLQSSLPAISSILPKLSQLKSITLDATPPLSWSALGSEFHTALRNSIRLPTIKSVGISDVNGFPLDTLDHCENVEHLQLFGQFTDLGGPIMRPYPPLCSLRVDGQFESTRVVSWAQGNLQNLSLSMSGATDLASFRTLLEACSSTLVNLELTHTCCGALRISATERSCFLIKFPVSPKFHPKAVLPELRFPLLEHVIVRSPVIFRHSKMPLSSLPFLAPFFVSNSSISAIYLSLHTEFKNIGRDPDFSNIAAFLCLPVFRHPIVLFISTNVEHPGALLAHLHQLKQNSDLRRLLENGKLVIAKNE